jgi:hypothetical protein
MQAMLLNSPHLRVLSCHGTTALVLLLFSGLVCGCASYNDATEAMMAAWTRGEAGEANSIATEAAQAEGWGRDAGLLWLEAGTSARADGDFAGSRLAFEAAQAAFERYDAQPRLSLTQQTASLLVNPTLVTYEPFGYDRIMLSTYQALNYLALGDVDGARVELRRIESHQRVSVERYQEALGEALQAQETRLQQTMEQTQSNQVDVAATQTQPAVQRELAEHYREVARYATYAPYVNPFSVWLDGIVHMVTARGPQDLERARLQLNRFKGMVMENTGVDRELLLLDRLMAGEPLPELVYVIFETGRGPVRRESRLDIPLFLITNEVKYVGAAVPNLSFQPGYAPALEVQTLEGSWVTSPAGSVDSVVATEFQHRMPIWITQALLSAGAKAAAQYAAKESFKGSSNEALGQLLSLAVAAYSYGSTVADLRTWLTLPKAFAVARLPAPADRRLNLGSPSSPQKVSVNLQPGRVCVVYVRSLGKAAPLWVHQFVLAP